MFAKEVCSQRFLTQSRRGAEDAELVGAIVLNRPRFVGTAAWGQAALPNVGKRGDKPPTFPPLETLRLCVSALKHNRVGVCPQLVRRDLERLAPVDLDLHVVLLSLRRRPGLERFKGGVDAFLERLDRLDLAHVWFPFWFGRCGCVWVGFVLFEKLRAQTFGVKFFDCRGALRISFIVQLSKIDAPKGWGGPRLGCPRRR